MTSVRENLSNTSQTSEVEASGGKLHRLPQLTAAPVTATVYFTEGKKDAEALARLDFVASTAGGGAAAPWDNALTPYFKDRRVVILPGADKVGRAHAQKVAKALNGVAASVKVVDLYPDRRDGSDVSDWLQHDPSGARLAKLVKAAPLWEPRADGGQDDGKTESHSDTSAGDTSGSADDLPATPLKKKQADVLIELADAVDLFHTPTRDAYADIIKTDHRETYRVRSKPFRSWLAHRYYEATKGAPNSEAMQSALGVIEARALFDGPEIAVHVRVAGHAGKLYLDLADQKWRAVEIDADGWRVIASPPVRFRRASGMLALPEPVSGGSINALRPLINVRKGTDGDADFVLVVAWLLAALRDVGPYPVLGLSGEQGVAKSMMSRFLRALIDPNTAPLRALPREDRDLFIAANNGHVLGFDNASGIPPWISDTLCRLATGGGFSVRQLYTDDSEMLFDAMRPAILNGIEDVATRPDLADRAILLTLESIPEADRRSERELWAAFDRERPRILGALLDAVAYGLKRLPHVRLDRLPRMADFAVWIAACETALWKAGTFADAYESNREAAVATTIEADPVASALLALMDTRDTCWAGTATELLGVLAVHVPETQRRGKGWPAQPNLLTGRLRRMAPAMRKIGIMIESDRERDRKRARMIQIRKTRPENRGSSSSASSASSAPNDIKDLQQTITDEPSSASSSDDPGPPLADDDADDQGRDTVRHNPLKTKASDDADDHLPLYSATPPRCAQCGGPLDDTESRCWIGGVHVWLHPGCQLPYIARSEAQAENDPR